MDEPEEGFVHAPFGKLPNGTEVTRYTPLSQYYPEDFAVDFVILSALAKDLRGFQKLDKLAERTAFVSHLATSPDWFHKIVGMQFCRYLNNLNAAQYRAEVEIGGAHALRYVLNSDLLLYYEAVNLLNTTPRCAALSTLLAVIDDPASPMVKRNNAFLSFTAISATKGTFDLQANSARPDEEIREQGLKELKEWYDKEYLTFLQADVQRVIEALESPIESKRMVGRIWLEAIASDSHGFDETDDPRARENALKQIKGWFDR